MKRLIGTFLISAALPTTLSAATVDGLKIAYATRGDDDRTIVFVHGWTCDSSSWQSQVPVFAEKHRVITVDLPGHGRSELPKDGKFSMDLFARAVEAVRAEADAGKIVLVGHSMGVPVIRQYARLFPQHVTALVAVDGPLDMRRSGSGRANREPPRFGGPEGLKARERRIRRMFTPTTPTALQQQILKMMLDTPEVTATGAMAAMFDPALGGADVTPVPTLAIIAGTGRLPNAGEMKKLLPKYEATQIAGTGHFLMMEKPEEFNKVLSAFLDKNNF
jgi:pimeloyl-ACP methyl ester carboxylesterase